MEFFGLTMYGPQNYIQDMMREEYKEPMTKEDVKPLVEKVKEYSTLPKTVSTQLSNIKTSHHYLNYRY